MNAIELVLNDVVISYGQIEIVHKISFTVRESLITGLIGSNGAGKTTTVRGILGLEKPASGSIVFAGTELAGLSTTRIVRQGIGIVPEGRRVFPSLSVFDNLRVGAASRNVAWGNPDGIRDVFALFPELERLRRHLAGSLSGGEQQMLAIGRALMMKPRLLILDEPSMGLAPKVVERIYETLIHLRDKGETTILIVEQNARTALEISDYAVVLESGNIAENGKASDIIRSKRIREIYLGA
jgi:branched-chain amino acid transport system ATP-binding protein